jgi:hypothetical protein
VSVGRPDFWYGQVLLFESSPTDGRTDAGPTSDWAHDHAANPSAHHAPYSDSEAVAAMGTKANANPLNHDRYTDAEATAAAKAIVQDTPQNGTTDRPISSNWAYDHKADASAHHTKTVSSEIDHGSVQGLADDDHPQYGRIDGTRHYTGTIHMDGIFDIFTTWDGATPRISLMCYTPPGVAFGVYSHLQGKILMQVSQTGDLVVNGSVTMASGSAIAYTPRGNPTADDFTKNNFSINTGWNNLYLGGIIPNGTKAVCLKVEFITTTALTHAWFDSTADTNRYCAVGVGCQVAYAKAVGCLVIPVDSQKYISYAIAVPPNEVNLLNVTVTGWWV